jgi:hypothetical protein
METQADKVDAESDLQVKKSPRNKAYASTDPASRTEDSLFTSGSALEPGSTSRDLYQGEEYDAEGQLSGRGAVRRFR